MILLITGSNAEKFKSCQDIFRLFFEDSKVKLDPFEQEDKASYPFLLRITEAKDDNEISLEVLLKDRVGAREYGNFQKEKIINPLEANNQSKRMARLLLYKLLVEIKGFKPGPWGILTGIRPTKIVHRLLDKGWQQEEIISHLLTTYEVDMEKAELVVHVAKRQRKYLLTKKEAKKLISVYIGIPFCPTRCGYCSFPAYSLVKEGNYLEPFLKALHKEIKSVGEAFRSYGVEVQTLYLGGGTPTSIEARQLNQLLQTIIAELNSNNTLEFTVEAGRPDSLNQEKFELLRDFGVSRISINPQSMNQKTLDNIGRKHTPEAIIDTFRTARSLGFGNINMDLIIGLPGEGLKDVEKTLEQVALLNPENLTIHTLALKRASRFKEEKVSLNKGLEEADTNKMLERTLLKAKGLGMYPYYLYRQKQMRGQLENIGFTKEGFDCIYNIQVMEERQTIIGLGAGSASKFIDTSDWTLESFYNPKDLLNYIERIDELIDKKLQLLKTCLDKNNVI